MGEIRICTVSGCDRPIHCVGLCPAHYKQKLAYGAPDASRPIQQKRPYRMSLEETFNHFLPEVRDPSECWEWQGVIAAVGYGQVNVGKKPQYAHRMSWELHHGRALEKGEQIRHSCDNRGCVNPAHLSTGSFYDNMQDAYERNRFKHTEEHWNAKLTAEDVREIRRLAAAGMYHRDIAPKFGVVRSAVTNIVNRKSWRQVD